MGRKMEDIANEMLGIARASSGEYVVATPSDLRRWATEIIEAKNDAVNVAEVRGYNRGLRTAESNYAWERDGDMNR